MSELPGLLQFLTPREKREIDSLIASLSRWRVIARPEQLPPPGDWRIWLLLAGRGFGKSRTIVEWACEQAMAMPGSRGAVVASTASDVRDVLVEGESGFMATETPPLYEPSRRKLSWPNGSIALLYSAEEPNRLRGPQQHWAIADELAAWSKPDAWDQLLFGLRLGTNPRVAVATTPRPTPQIKAMLKDATCVVTRGSTYANRANLAPAFFQQIVSRYEGTRLGRQEINAEILDDAPGALWHRAMIDEQRAWSLPPLLRVVVAIDPAVTSGEDADETGIVCAGIDADGHYYVMADASMRSSPDQWARAAVGMYHNNKADRIVAEVNNGGEMVELTIHTIDKTVAYRAVHATRGKRTRAEPIAALYEQNKVHHAGMFGALEDQMCGWEPGLGDSPDRVDALVWALTELLTRAPMKAARSRQG